MSSKVTVTFEGLMVFHAQSGTDHHEVGILANVSQHQFRITYGPEGGVFIPVPVELFPGNRWQLDVIKNGAPLNKVDLEAKGHNGRKDKVKGQKDFNWLLHIEELHPGVTMQSGMLNPIIRMNNGRLRSYCKTRELNKKRRGDVSSLGFIADVTALEIELHSGEAAVLSVTGAGPMGVMFVLPNFPDTSYRVRVENVSGSGGTSHFHHYYDHLFPAVPPGDRYELELTPNGDRPDDDCLKGISFSDVVLPKTEEAVPLTVDPYVCGGLGSSGALS